jgi:polysaccharide biosynthesis transport protein
LRTTIVICTANRVDVLEDTVRSILESQTKAPALILVCVHDQSHVSALTRARRQVDVITCPRKGLTIQRNFAALQIKTEFALFLDDDVELAPNYIESMERLADSRPEMAAATAHVAADGAQGDTGISRDWAKKAVEGYRRTAEDVLHEQAYGCNMFVRTTTLDVVSFDEKLALYGWLEDLDFATRCLKHGSIFLNRGTCMVHLATPTGRIAGVCFGYAQIVNPLYLWRKNRRPTLRQIVIAHGALPILRNLRRVMIDIPSGRDDRKGRFRGNMLALRDILRGKLDPQRIGQIET